MVFRKPEPTDKMTDHAEQHGFIYDEVSNLQNDKSDKAGDTFTGQVTIDRPSNEMLVVKKAGNTTLTVWADGSMQQANVNTNTLPTDVVNRKNLTDAVDPLVEQVEHNDDRINALETELEAVAETKSAGEWKLVSTIAQAGDMSLSDNSLITANNVLTLHQTDLNGVSHGFSGVEVGDLVELLEEHELMTRNTGDYGLYKVTGVNGQAFTLELQQGRGIAELNKRFYVKFFYLSEDVNIAELDARYAQKSHSHNYASTNHTHNYAPDTHTHNYAPDTHTHSSYASSNHTHSSVPSHSHNYASSSHSHDYASSSHTHAVKFKSGTSTSPSLSKGEPYLNTSQKVVYVGL
jgi:hypothetical protein